MDNLEMVITARARDIGGFHVRRLLPYATHRMVGPFIFFDHMGPAEFPPGQALEVRPHPHISLATVTYLFEGRIHHRDSLGSNQMIEPGAINWMTAGTGIVHSERSAIEDIPVQHRMNGIQIWVALPNEAENVPPSFVHHPKETLPEFKVGHTAVKLLLGKILDHQSPVKTHSELFYLETLIPAGESFTMPVKRNHEVAFYVESGEVQVGEKTVLAQSMAIGKAGESLTLKASQWARVLWIGGEPVGERFIFWNFVSSSEAQLEKAKADWLKGPGKTERFPLVPGDDQAFIPLPETPTNPRGTVL